jgi:hypothetical protein
MPDEAQVQRERIERVAKKIKPDCVVDFIIHGDAQIRFRVFNKSGTALIERSGSWAATCLANFSDKELADLLSLLSTGRMAPHLGSRFS